MVGHSEKGSHYISLLENARVNSQWSEFPELIRKVNKHAPQRKTLIQTATAEHEIATAIGTRAGRPTTSSGAQLPSLATLSSALRSDQVVDAEDLFQGKTCLLWARWVGLEGTATTAGFDTPTAVRELDGKNTSTWTKICIVKSAYMEGTNYMRNGRPTEAQRIFSVALAIVQPNQELTLSTAQLAYWTEQLLAQLATGSKNSAQTNTIDASQLEAFKQWGIIASKTREVSATTFGNSTAHLSRLPVWKRYYEYLSTELARRSYHAEIAGPSSSQKATELRKVERAYESELLRVTKFPTASESNTAMEQWVEQAIRNWQILCGPHWRDSELGEGGRNAIARNMLDILYRAATKTFHSTLILRRLFQVHLSLGEFDLAYRAFDTYIELVDRGRVRVAKSKISEPGHESDEVVSRTMSEAIAALCKYGRQTEARRAYDLSLKLERWLGPRDVTDTPNGEDKVYQNGDMTDFDSPSSISSQTLQDVYRAIGTAKAHWARWTPESENRTELQEEALKDLRTACSQGDPEITTLYAMSLLMAETRNLTGAIRAAKQALAISTSSNKSSSGWIMERKLVSQWHLLALLLSSRQDFEGASKSCFAAFEQFADELQLAPERNASVASNIEKQFNAAVSSFADEMECDELQRIIEVRITELALIELIDGPEEAVNSCNELLSLFSHLFAHAKVPIDTPAVARSLAPPKSSAGTVKSTRTGIFRHSKHTSPTSQRTERAEDRTSTVIDNTRPSTRATQAPTIQVTQEDEPRSQKKHHFRKSYESSQSKISTSTATRKPSHRHSHQNEITNTSQPNNQIQSSHPGAPEKLSDVEETATPLLPLEHEKSTGTRQDLPEPDHDLDSHTNMSPSVSHEEQPPEQDVKLPTLNAHTNSTSPAPRFPKSAMQRQALTILVKVWLIIATLYRRASMFDDSKEACEEASKVAGKIEAIAGAVDGSARAYAEAGWGVGTKSTDEVWADVFCERAELQLAIHRKKVETESENATIGNDEVRTAVDHYEQCLMFVPNHPGGIIGLSNVLLDSYERKVDLGRRVNDGRLQLIEQDKATTPAHNPDETPHPTITNTNTNGSTPTHTFNTGHLDSHPHPHPHQSSSSPQSQSQSQSQSQHQSSKDEDLKKTPENLNRIAARDRAYGLLSTLTRLGSGWDNAEAWFALARAHELGGEVEKAKSVLWWCVELEDTRPVRHWSNLGYCL